MSNVTVLLSLEGPFSDIRLITLSVLFTLVTLCTLRTLLALLRLAVLLLRISLADIGMTTPSAFKLNLENFGGAAVESQFNSGSRDVEGLPQTISLPR